MKFRRPFLRISSGGTDQKKKLKKTRSIKRANIGSSRPSTRKEDDRHDQSSIILSSDVDTLPRHSKAHFQASPCNSESSFGSNDQNGKNLKIARPNSDSSVRAVKRTATLRPQRILTKTASLKSNKSSMKKSSEVSEISESSIVRATCSSTLKDSKFPHRSELQQGGSDSKDIQALKVCSYSYCSLHGHHHGTVPPLKRFVSMRRRLLKTQKSMKSESHSVPKAKRSKNRRKGAQTSQVTSNRDSADQETLYTDPSFEQQKTSNPLIANQQTQVAISARQGTSEECHCITTESVKVIPEANNAGKEEEEIVVSGLHNGDDKSILTVDPHTIIESSLRSLKDSIKCDDQCLKLDDVVSTSHERVPEDADVHKEVNGDTIAPLNLEVHKDNCELDIKVSEASTTSREINEEKDEDSEPDNGFLEELSPSGDSTPDCTTDQPQQTQMAKQKYMGLWGLIYQHMASSMTTEVETEAANSGKNKEEQVKDKYTVSQMNDSFSCQGSTGTNEDMVMGDHDADDQKFELWQSNAIKQVQQAFDKIFSEIPDQSSDDRSSDVIPEQEVLENNQYESGQQSISSYLDCTKERIVQDQEEAQLEEIHINSTEEEKAELRVANKSSKQISKSWSSLKKVIILKRFVKALEKVKKFNPGKPQYLPRESDPEAEKINLRHQTVEERKNADEWMLDYALRQVISALAPAQKRKVALLVQAFETVTPPEIRTCLRSSATASSHTAVQEYTDSITQMGEQNNSAFHKALCPKMSFEKTTDQVSNFSTAERHLPETCSVTKERSLGCGCSNTEMDLSASETTQTNLKQEDSIFTDDQPGFTDVSSTNPKELKLFDKPTSKQDDSKKTSPEEVQVNGKIILEASNEVPLIHDLEFHDRDTEFNGDKLETGNVLNKAGEQSCLAKSLSPENYAESTVVSSTISLDSSPKLFEDPRAACGEEANTNYEVLQTSYPQEVSEPCDTDTIDMAQESKLEKQKYMRLWYLIYEHMVSSSNEAGAQQLLGGADKEEQESNTNALLGMKDADSSKEFADMNHTLIMENQNAGSRKIDCHQIEAIKIIEQAIDEIPLPDIQDDSPHEPSTTDNMLQEQALQRKHGKDGELFISTSNDSVEDSFRESKNTKVENDTVDSRETRLNSNNITAPEESETFSKSENRSKPQMQKSWSHLKKVILLKRFIKSLEKVRKFNPREPRYLPLKPDTGAEKVHLRHQDMEDRKNAEEWMLDHALQQVVTKLNPARKRKVELLVEAFETVTPMLEVKAGQRCSAASSPQPRLIHA